MSPPSDRYIPNGEISFLGGPTLVDNPLYITPINTDSELRDLVLKHFSRMKEAPGQYIRFGSAFGLLDDNTGVGVFNGELFRNIVVEISFDLIRCVPSATSSDLSDVVNALREEFIWSFRAQSTKLSLDNIREAMSGELPYEYKDTNFFSLNGVSMEATVKLEARRLEYLTRP